MSNTVENLASFLKHEDDISDLSAAEWLGKVKEASKTRGSFKKLGGAHAAAFVAAGEKLIVSFESYDSCTERSENGYPIGMSIAAERGWSSLTILTTSAEGGDPWFRAQEVYEHFDRMVYEGVFEEFEQVVFYGAGPAGYAAGAFSVTAPGATAVLIAPQATLTHRLASWDNRYTGTQKLDFTSRYGFAPFMMEGLKNAFVFYDPSVSLDTMHAALFSRPHIELIPLRMFGVDPEYELLEMNALHSILDSAMDGTIGVASIRKSLRVRRKHLEYLRRLQRRIPEEQPLMMALICRHILKLRPGAPRFRKIYLNAVQNLVKAGRNVPFDDMPSVEKND